MCTVNCYHLTIIDCTKYRFEPLTYIYGLIITEDFVVSISWVLYRPKRLYSILRSHLKNVSVTEICVALEIFKNIWKHFDHSMICFLDNLKIKFVSSNAMLFNYLYIFVIEFLANSSSRPKNKTRHFLTRHYPLTDLYCNRCPG